MTHPLEGVNEDAGDGRAAVAVHALVAEVLHEQLAPRVERGVEALVMDEHDRSVLEADDVLVHGADERADGPVEQAGRDEARLLLDVGGCWNPKGQRSL